MKAIAIHDFVLDEQPETWRFEYRGTALACELPKECKLEEVRDSSAARAVVRELMLAGDPE